MTGTTKRYLVTVYDEDKRELVFEAKGVRAENFEEALEAAGRFHLQVSEAMYRELLLELWPYVQEGMKHEFQERAERLLGEKL